MTVCLPVRMGTECLRLDACAGFNGADGACIVEPRVNDTGGRGGEEDGEGGRYLEGGDVCVSH